MTLPVAQPAYVLRGHGSQIHATVFIRSNTRLVTADADGWVIIWDLSIKRPTAVWRAHEGSILGVRVWGSEKLITHGKDNKLIAWKVSEEDEATLSTILPVDNSSEPRKQPWLLHMLHVNTMNFCSFAQCPATTESQSLDELLVAVPNTLSSESVDIFHLPSEKRIHTVPNSQSFKGGMIMAISIFHHPITNKLTVIAGYESGYTSVTARISTSWQTLYISQPHTQPILSLDITPSMSKEFFYLTSSADSNIAKHPIPSEEVIGSITTSLPLKTIQTKHSGQQSLQVRNDGKIFATAGWDSKVRVYGLKTMKELAVLKWHKEGCYSVAFAEVTTPDRKAEQEESSNAGNPGGQEVVKLEKALTVAEERKRKAMTTHWLAVGSKDGKVSLWDIY